MKKAVILLLLGTLLSGCATYKFHQNSSAADKGYIVSYNGKPVPEYTQGEGKLLPPDKALAKERFKRRCATVNYYYKKMGQIENRFQEYIWQPVTLFADFVGGVLGWPFMAVADYKYNHNPQYKERVDRLDEERDALEKERLDGLKAKLSEYIQADLAKEQPVKQSPPGAKNENTVVLAEGAPAAIAPSVAPETTQPPAVVEQIKEEKAPAAETSQPKITEAVEADTQSQVETFIPAARKEPVVLPAPAIKFAEPRAVILARPQKGLSPLTVKFFAGKSSSANGRIISYRWDFGDGDSSTLKNPSNTYWSTSYGTKSFTAILTIKDDKGQTSSASVNIDVLTK